MTDLVRMGSLGKGGVRGVAKQVKVERPRPLKIGGGAHPELSLEDLLVEIERFRKSLGVKGEGGSWGSGRYSNPRGSHTHSMTVCYYLALGK